MEIIRLKAPRPWPRPRRVTGWDFPISGVLRARDVRQRRLGALEKLLGSRQSRREFAAPLTLQQLGDLLWHAYRVRRRLRRNGVWESRPCPSGGGCYPISVVALRMASLPKVALVYYAGHHAFGVRELPTRGVLRRAVADVGRCLKAGKGTILWFVADLGWSGGRYENPESLAWRDSGALLATIGLVAEGMGLNCCGIGVHDLAGLRGFLRLEDWMLGVGGCVVSGRDRSRPG
jgi:SagB-type dehydrogenase family enzyme